MLLDTIAAVAELKAMVTEGVVSTGSLSPKRAEGEQSEGNNDSQGEKVFYK